MSSVEDDDVLGEELAFYSKYPEELDLIYVDGQYEANRGLFEFLDEKQYQEMNKLSFKICDAAAEQAKEMVLMIRDKLREVRHVKTENIKLKEAWWDSALRIKKSSRSKECKVECRVIIETDSGELVARVRMMVRGSTRPELLKILSGVIDSLPETPNHSDSNEIVLSAVNIREASSHGRTKVSILEELVAPIFKLTKKEWDMLFAAAN